MVWNLKKKFQPLQIAQKLLRGDFLVPAITLVIVFIDQLTKTLVLNKSSKLPVDIIRGFFSITLVQNEGAAFGILRGCNIFFIVVSIFAIIIILYGQFSIERSKKTGVKLLKIALALILGGAIGNMIDRIRFGCVIDFFDFKVWPVFNVADSAITIGGFLLVIFLFLPKTDSNKR